MPFLLILMGIIALAIVLDSPGSPFFVQNRVGKDRRVFRLYKFRTMRCDYNDQNDRLFMQAYIAGQMEGVQESRGDRDALYKPVKRHDITKIGRFLRKASLDELPQVFNILKGEMSLIGPRPNVTWEVDAYSEWHLGRLALLPGITGLAQINGRSNITFDEIAAYDIQYINNIGFWMDMWIIWQTLKLVGTGNGAG